MKINNSLHQKQAAVLTQLMKNQLELLQLPVMDINQQIQEAALSNPLIRIEDEHCQSNSFLTVDPKQNGPLIIKHMDSFNSRRQEHAGLDAAALLRSEKKFSDYLLEQLGEMKHCDHKLFSHCSYIIGCLDSSGYLSCSAEELSRESGIDVFDIEQAILAVQMLDPAGVGARSLSECLLLQLMRGESFNSTNIHAIQYGLELVAENRIDELAQQLGVDKNSAAAAAEVIRELNPIPSRGYNTGAATLYIVPEAFIYQEHGSIVVEMNEWYLPRVVLDEEYCAMIGDGRFPEAQSYLKENRSRAKELIAGLEKRQTTMMRLLGCVVQEQQAYFLGGELRPMTMQHLAERLELGVSTVSRAIKDKYVLVNGRMLPLRALFNAAAGEARQGCTVDAVRLRISALVDAEDKASPLSDQSIAEALNAMGIKVSRRTVQIYRRQLGIPDSRERKKK